MQITGLDHSDVLTTVDRVSRERYADNLAVVDSEGFRSPDMTFVALRTSVKSPDGPGARREPDGGWSICRHAYRDVVDALLNVRPGVVIDTGWSRFSGQSDFRNHEFRGVFPGTCKCPEGQ